MNILQRLELDHLMTSVAKEPTLKVDRTDFRRTNYFANFNDKDDSSDQQQ
jgi:hypothetical protein